MPDDGPQRGSPPVGEGIPEEAADPADVSVPGIGGAALGRFEILEELGRGGMGVVYRARDPRLDRDVALKFLPGFLTNDPEARRRFIAEAKAASALDHPNICTIYEIGESEDDRVYIAMSYYDGETLKDKLARGPLPLSELLALGVQISRGLSKAHERDIVHRDIKPANVMVTKDGVVKILDFGTAKRGDVQLTQTGAMVGTVAYMSPEQAEADPVDARSDLWSLGALLYQMASGEPPFKAGHPVATLHSILTQNPTALTEVAQVPAELATVVGRCLEKKPEDRYASAHELALELEKIARQEGVEIALADRSTRTRAPRAKRRALHGWLAGLAAAAVVLTALPATRTVLFSAMGFGGERNYLAVVPFTPGDNVIAAGLTISLTSMIAQLGRDEESLWVVPASDVLRLGVSDAQAAWNTFNATTIVEGVVGQEGSVTLNLIETDGQVSRVINSAQLPDPEDADFLPEARVVLASFFGMGSATSATVASTEADVAPEAYPFYLRGVGYLERFYDRESLALAETLFRQALRGDPGYAPARAGLCRALWELHVWDQDLSLVRDARSECDRAAVLADDDPSVLIPLANIYLATGLHARATEIVNRAIELDPENADAYRGLGSIYEDQGRTADAEAAYRRAIELRPDLWFHQDALGQLLLFDGRSIEAAEVFERVRLLAPDNHLADVLLGVAKMQSDQFAEAESVLRSSIVKQPDAIAYRNLGHLYFLQARFDEAVEELETGLGLTETDWYIWRLLGHAQYWAGDTERAETSWRRALTLAGDRLTVNPNDVDALSGVAEVHAALGEPERSQAYLDRLADLPLKWNLMPFYTGRAHEMLSQREEAFTYIESALEARLSVSWIERDPWLEDFRRDPRYADVIGRYSNR